MIYSFNAYMISLYHWLNFGFLESFQKFPGGRWVATRQPILI